MTSRYDVWLNGVALSSIDPCIYVSNIAYQAPTVTRHPTKIAARDGQYAGQVKTIDTAKITVNFVARAYSTVERQRVVQNVVSWASKGGILQATDRAGQFIRVETTRLPAVASVLGWTDVLTVEFQAFDYPFWQDETPTTTSVDSGETGTLYVPGSWTSDIEVEITATEALTEAEIICGDSIIVLEGLSIAAGGKIVICYTADHHILEIKDGAGNSLLDKRTAESSDDLRADPGSVAVAVEADGSAVCTFKAKGAYL